jgi:uncharacterized protein YjbI with pentapeptide repeats
VSVDPPDLPEFESPKHDLAAPGGELLLDGVCVELQAPNGVCANRVQVAESELRGLTIEAGSSPGLRLTDVVLRDCDLSNVDGREGALTRVEIRKSRLVGFSLTEGTVRDLKVVDSALSLGSFAYAELRNVAFERVNLREASFMNAQLVSVEFIECHLEGADFRGVSLESCAMRGGTLDGILGVESLRGLAMSWPDVVSSAAALAAALGIKIEPS